MKLPRRIVYRLFVEKLRLSFIVNRGRKRLRKGDSHSLPSHHPTIPPSDFLPGSILVLAIIFLFFILAISIVTFTNVASFIRSTTGAFLQEQSVNVSDAGIDYAIWQLSQDSAWTGTNGPPVKVGNSGEFTITVVDKSPNKQIVSTGYIPQFAGFTTRITSKVEVKPQQNIIPILYAVHAGTGGITCSTGLDVVVGQTFSNGIIDGQEGEEDCDFYGESWAVSDIDDAIVSSGGFHAGWNEFYDPPNNLPLLDFAFWQDKADDGGTVDCSVYAGNTCTIQGTVNPPTCTPLNTNIGPKKYQGNLKVLGRVNLTIDGPIYVTGDLDVGSTTGVNCDNLHNIYLNNSFLGKSTVFVVGGKIRLYKSDIQIFATNNTPKGYIMLATPDDGNYSAPAIKHDSTQDTLVILYAPNGTIRVTTFGGGPPEDEITAVMGKEVRFDDQANGEIRWDPNLSSAVFSPTPIESPAGWEIVRGTYKSSK